MTYSHNWLKRKWLIAKRKGKSPIRVAHLRFRTKKRAQKKVSELNKAYKGSDTRFLV